MKILRNLNNLIEIIFDNYEIYRSINKKSI